MLDLNLSFIRYNKKKKKKSKVVEIMLASFNDLTKNELLPFLALKYCGFKNNRRKYKN